jgi:hypothetical protein
MSAGRLIALAVLGIAAAIFAGTAVGHAVAPGEGAPAPSTASPRPKPPDPAVRAALVPLDRARVVGRTALQRADTPAGQAVAALRLAAAHWRAAARLTAPLGARLAATARAYEALSAAAGTGSSPRYLRARRLVAAAESALARAVDAARKPPPAPRPAAASPSPPAPASPSLLLVLIGVAATAAIGLFVGATTSPAPSPPAGVALAVKTERGRHDPRLGERDDGDRHAAWRRPSSRQARARATTSRVE